MAPAEIGIFRFGEGPSSYKVHTGEWRDFTVGNINVRVSCDSSSTAVETTGSDVSYMTRTKEMGLVLSHGDLKDDKKSIFLLNQEVQLLKLDSLDCSLKINHTEHDGSTGEIG